MYPRFSDEKEFELFVNEIFIKRTNNINFQIYWRKWQKQYWIDWYWYDFLNWEFIVTQCKNYTSDKENKDKFQKDFLEALSLFDKEDLPFKNKVQRFYYVTSVSRDIKFSNGEENEINSVRQIPFKILTWEDLCDELEKHNDILYNFFLKELPSWKAENLDIIIQSRNDTIWVVLWEWNTDEKLALFTQKFLEKININSSFTNYQENDSTLLMWFYWFDSKPDFNWIVDIDLNFSQIYKSNSNEWLDDFLDKIATMTNHLQKQVWLRRVILQSHIQPCLSLYIWKYLSKSTSWIEFVTIIKNQLFISSKSKNLIYAEPEISEKKIYINENWDEQHIAFFYNISQPNLDIKNEIQKPCFKKFTPKYWFQLDWKLIRNSSQWFSQVKYVVNKIQDIANQYKTSSWLNIHLILVCPEQIAFILWSLLMRTNANIFLYYQNDWSTDYNLFWKIPN